MRTGKKFFVYLILGVLIILGVIIVSFYRVRSKQAINQKENEWTITQYSSPSDYQAMFYTIKDKIGNLTVVDGGYREDADYVKEIIKKEGGVVKNWIITHPHPDHVGAFNYIYEHNQDEISVAHIYAVWMDYDSYKEKAKEWDGFHEYESFLNVTKGSPNLTYVQDGDKWDMDGLKVKVFNAYSEKINELSKDLANDGSMMFKIQGNKESMLFCADVGHKISEKIIADYKEELPSDYIQMGHHGNGGLTEEFYRYVSPKGAFFDAPEWLMKNIVPDTGKEGKWDTPKKIALMEELGAQVYGYPAAPNQITLK